MEDKKEIILRNKNSRNSLKHSVSTLQTIKSCFCFARGASSIALSCEQAEHSAIGLTSSFNIEIKDNLSVAPLSVVSQLIFNLELNLLGKPKLSYTNLVARHKPEIEKKTAESRDLSFEADLSKVQYGDNPCSNVASLFTASYMAQVFLLYSIGCRTKKVEVELPIHVNPRFYDQEAIKVPIRWSPKTPSMANLIVETSKNIETKTSENNYIN